MYVEDPPPDHRRIRRVRRRRLAVGTTLAVALAFLGFSPLPSAASGAGAGPLPVQFKLTDNNGAWYDTGLTLFGTKSLGVAVLPRTGLSSLPLDVNGLLNNTGAAALLQNLPLGTLLGALPGGSNPLINLDQLTDAVNLSGGLLGFLNPNVQKAKQDINALVTQLQNAPAGVPINLGTLPVGVDLMNQLAALQALSSPNLSLSPIAQFHVGAPEAASTHTVTSLIYPYGSQPIDQTSAFAGDVSKQLTEPGLYAWACKVHPYMLGAVVVDDPLTPGLDFGKKLVVNARGGNLVVPSNANIIQQLVQKFFRITSPGNWQTFSNTVSNRWDPVYPPAPILMYDAAETPVLIPSLDAYYQSLFTEGVDLPALTQRPAVPGVGEVWIDAQMAMTAGKTKPGVATKIDVQNWTIARTVALPQINMNNPHNMWTDRNGNFIYQTEWFSDRLTVFDRRTGALVRTLQVGPDPSHVMTRVDTDQLHVAINGGNQVVEVAPGGTGIDRRLMTQYAGEKPAHPHAHWMSADGRKMITPNVNNNDAAVFQDLTQTSGVLTKGTTGQLPIATSMMPDNSKAYVANFLGQSVSCVSLDANACRSDAGTLVNNKTIDLWGTYDPVSGASSGAFGGLPIQLPTSPDGQAVLVANTLTSNIAVIDPDTDKVVKYLPCDSGCHGINFGAKQGGGYYAYVSSKFANSVAVVDADPNGDGNPADAAIVGKFVLDQAPGTANDDPVVAYNGMGGQGVFAYPIVYNGWVQNAPAEVAGQLTCRQLNPINLEAC